MSCAVSQHHRHKCSAAGLSSGLESSSGRHFPKSGVPSLQKIESSFAHSHTEFHGFQRLPYTPFHCILAAQEGGGFCPFSWNLEAKVQRGGVFCVRGDTRLRQFLPFSSLLISLTLCCMEVVCGASQVAFTLVCFLLRSFCGYRLPKGTKRNFNLVEVLTFSCFPRYFQEFCFCFWASLLTC